MVFTAANIYLGLQRGDHHRLVDSGGRDLDGDPARVQHRHDPRKQHRPDGGVIGRNALGHHLRTAGPGHDRLLAGLRLLTTFLICALGGILGVLFSIPLRRALVVNTPLPFPEGVAAAEVLKVGATGDEATADAIERNADRWSWSLARSVGGPAGHHFHRRRSRCRTSPNIFVGRGRDRDRSRFFAGLLGAGHLVGLSVGLAMLVGLFITWARFRAALDRRGMSGDRGDDRRCDMANQVRFVGAGAIGTAAIWSMMPAGEARCSKASRRR